MYLIRRIFTSLFGPLGAGRCVTCNKSLSAEEREYYECECERCVGRSMGEYWEV